MGKAFVSKLAREGARDPEALAAWIGRKKHGATAFKKLAAAGRKTAANQKKTQGARKKTAPESPEVRNARAQVEAAGKRAAAARERADRANESASAGYGRFAGGQKILSGHHSERSALRDRSRADAQTRRAIAATEEAKRAEAEVRRAQADAQGAEMRAGRSRPWQAGDFKPGDTVVKSWNGRPGEKYTVVRANAKSLTVRHRNGVSDTKLAYDKVLSRARDGETTSDPGAGTPAGGALPEASGKAAPPSAAASRAAVSEELIESGRREARVMPEATLRRVQKSLVGRRDERAKAQRMVIADELRRRREEDKANAEKAKAKRERQHARLMERLQRDQAERERAEAERVEAERKAAERAAQQAAQREATEREAQREREWYAERGRRIDEERARKAEENLRKAAEERQRRAVEEQAQRAARQREAFERISAAPGKPTRKAMTPEERQLVNNSAITAATDDRLYEQLRPFADESAQTNRLDVLKGRAFNKAREQRRKNGWRT